jgi:hypothetical protein
MNAQSRPYIDTPVHSDSPNAPVSDAATNMTPLPQPTGPTATQTVLDDLPDFKMYKETVVVEI